MINLSTGELISNTDSKARAEHAAYNGFMFKKYVDESWLENGHSGAPTTYPYLRYGDVLLMYAEAMNELGECDQEVLNLTINELRKRAYRGTGIDYPVATVGSQQAMRTMIRTERFIEMAFEGWRYPDPSALAPCGSDLQPSHLLPQARMVGFGIMGWQRART